MTLKTWIITFDPQKPQVTQLKSQLEAKDIVVDCFPAIDGRKQLPVLQDDERLVPVKALLNKRSLLSASEVGCYLSHYRAIKQAYTEGFDYVCLFEDDVVAEAGLGQLIHDLMAQPVALDMVRFMALKQRKRKVVRPINSRYTLVRPQRGALGTQGYLLSRQGMQKVLSYGAQITMAIDKFYDSFFLFNLHCYSVEPHAIYELAQPSSIVKNFSSLDRRLWVRLGWRLNKLHRSIWRHCHRLAHYGEFHPAAKPPSSQGKSARFRE